MAEDCKNALREISSGCCFDTLTEEGRLHCDVFGALAPRKKNFNRSMSFNKTLSVNTVTTEGDELDALNLDSLEAMEKQLKAFKVSQSDNQHDRPKVARSSSCIMGKNSKASSIDLLKKKKKRQTLFK